VPTALVTGASSGLGKAFVTRLAARGYDLVLVARDAQRLQDVAGDLQHRFGCSAEVLPADLVDRSQLQHVADRLSDSQRPVELLVNNAGHAVRKPFVATSLQAEEDLLDLHVRATLVLTHAAVGAMAERGSGGVINVSSVAGWLPQGSYSAHKAWVTTFSQAVASQVAGRGVHVMALAPGFVRTEFHQRAGIKADSIPAPAWLDADDVVEETLRAWERGHAVHVPSTRYRAAATVLRNAPYETVHRLRTRRRR
jgi:short-subunit dehydrogenase